MKKVIFIFVTLIVAVVLLNSCQPTEKRVLRIISSQNDSLIMAQYLKTPKNTIGLEKLKLVADSVALETVYGARLIIGRYRDEKDIPTYTAEAIQIMEENYGSQKTVNQLMATIAYPYSRCFEKSNFVIWDRNISLIEKMVSSAVLAGIRDSVAKQQDDPILKSRYLSKEAIAQACIVGKFSEYEALSYAYIDSVNQKKILAKISDKTLINAQCTDIISDERRLRIARKASFFYSEAFLLKTNEEKSTLFLESLQKLPCSSIIDCAEKYYEYRNENIIRYLKGLKTEMLTESFPGKFIDENVGAKYHFEKEEWLFHFSYVKYSLIVISSVKNQEDFELATNFFLMNSHKGEETSMLNILIQSKKKFL